MKKTILFSLFLLSALLLTAQAPSFNWAKSIGSLYFEAPNTVLSDAAGNVFVLGNYEDTTDFDPGPLTYTLAPSTAGNTEAFLLKLDAAGNFLWAKSFGNEVIVSLVQSSMQFDAAGNILITGAYKEVADFDPGPATHTLGLANSNVLNCYLLKLDANGNFMWVKDFQTLVTFGVTVFSDISLDPSGNIHIFGYYNGLVDFDPDPAITYTLNPPNPGNMSYVALKLNSTGDFIWAKAIENTQADGILPGLSLASDPQGNVLLSGSFIGTVDFDPGAGNTSFTFNSAFYQGSAFVVKLDPNGNFVWVRQVDCPTGTWANNKDLVCDNTGNIYVCGWGAEDADLDPGPAVFSNYNGGLTEQGYLFKLDPAGNFVWGNFIVGDNVSFCTSITLNNLGDVLVIGDYTGTYDFDGGPATYTMTSPSPVSYETQSFICSYNSAGNFLWANGFGGGVGGYTVAENITTNGAEIYATGFFTIRSDYDPTAGISNLPNVLGMDVYILKLTSIPCVTPPAPANATAPAQLSVCAGSTTTLSVNTGSGTVTWYATPTSTTAIGSGTVYVTPVLAAGTYTYYAGATTCVSSATRTAITVTATTLPVLTASTFSSTICSGSTTTLTANASSAVNYSWSTGANTATITVSPTVTTTYTVTGSNACGAASTSITQYVSTCTGIDEYIDAEAISMYPNPANHELSIAIPAYLVSESTIVEVTDALGKLVMKEALSRDINTFNINALKDGMYFFRVITNKQTIKTGKVVKQ